MRTVTISLRLGIPEASLCRVEELVSVVDAVLIECNVADPSSRRTLMSRVSLMRRWFVPFCVDIATALDRPLVLSDVTADLILQYRNKLLREQVFGVARTIFSSTKSLLMELVRRRLLPPSRDLFPAIAFRNGRTPPSSTPPYSQAEKQRFLRALAADLADIRQGRFDGAHIDKVVVLLLFLAWRTGFNLAPLLLLTRDALKAHPVKKDHYLLVSWKQRAHRDVQVPLRAKDVEGLAGVGLDAGDVYRLALQLTAEAAQEADVDRLWVYKAELSRVRGGREQSMVYGGARIVGVCVFHKWAVRFGARHQLVADDGRALPVSTKMIRATVAGRIYELSKGDPFAVAKVLNNQPAVTNRHYMALPEGADAAFAKAQDLLWAKLKAGRSTDPAVSTPVGACSDPVSGKYAAGTGAYCQRFLQCFVCPNQVIREDDLWRLYSFYWCLQAHSQQLSRAPFSGLVRNAIRLVDNVVGKHFGSRATEAKQQARDLPHPFWREAKALGMFGGDVA